MKKIFFQIEILLFLITGLKAQPSDPGLQLGDRVPDISMGKYLNEPGRKMKISDFRGKLLVIDFWGTRCKSCIAHMPRMDSLQKQFGSKIEFVYVTSDSEEKVNELFSKIKIRKPDVPFFVGDTQFKKMFPHSGDPLHVWITPNGIVYAITEDYNTNETTLASYFEGQNPNIPRRWDWGVNRKYPLISEQNAGLLAMADSYSVWLKGVHNLYTGTGIHILKNHENHETGLQLINVTLKELYGLAFLNDLFQVPVNYFGLVKNNRLIFELKDTSVLTVPKDYSNEEAWNLQNNYTYELKLPENPNETVFDVLKKDIGLRLPQYLAQVEKRKMKCLVLSDLPGVDQDKAKSGSDSLPSVIIDGEKDITFQNIPIRSFIENLIYSYSYLDTPFVTETNFKGNLQMQLKARPANITEFNKELNRFGFQLSIEERDIPMLVVKDQENAIAAQ